jgi:hypothetical protein
MKLTCCVTVLVQPVIIPELAEHTMLQQPFTVVLKSAAAWFWKPLPMKEYAPGMRQVGAKVKAKLVGFHVPAHVWLPTPPTTTAPKVHNGDTATQIRLQIPVPMKEAYEPAKLPQPLTTVLNEEPAGVQLEIPFPMKEYGPEDLLA